jgi:antitoxin CcdA
MTTLISPSTKKGRISLSISQEVLDRLESHKADINLSAETEQLFKTLLNKLENQEWVKRNANALVAHGEAITKSGLAGQEFERI